MKIKCISVCRNGGEHIFGVNGLYGASQDLPWKVGPYSREGKLIRSIIKKYYPTYDEYQVEAFLEKLCDEGCGYVAGVNMIFIYFHGREEEFEQKFGFPMYSDTGRLNYNLLLVDYYAATDNHFCYMGRDEICKKEDCTGYEILYPYDGTFDETGKGMSNEDRRYRLNLYLDNKGIKVKITDKYYLAPEEIRSSIQSGYVYISLFNGNVQREDGSPYCYCEGHGMLITGITSDCRYIVSSWGKKLYIDPTEIVERDGKRTRHSYQYYEFV